MSTSTRSHDGSISTALEEARSFTSETVDKTPLIVKLVLYAAAFISLCLVVLTGVADISTVLVHEDRSSSSEAEKVERPLLLLDSLIREFLNDTLLEQ